jgi:hypothetical protein
MQQQPPRNSCAKIDTAEHLSFQHPDLGSGSVRYRAVAD